MAENTLQIPQSVQDAFTSFLSNPSQLALPLQISSSILQTLPPVPFPDDPSATFQTSLAKLDAIINTRTPLYLLIRHKESLTTITYVPYLADAALTEQYLSHRELLLQTLGEANFAISVICKEPGGITDARAWEELEERAAAISEPHDSHSHNHDDVENNTAPTTVKDLGHQKTKCRLCDRRMKNPIDDTAFEALKNMKEGGDCVQLSVHIATQTLTLTSTHASIPPSLLPSKIPPTTPSFTFYIHPSTQRLYFIFFSPDSADVKVRMVHTMAVPGLVNVIAKEAGLKVQQSIEIHDVEDLEFEGEDERVGRFRSVYLLGQTRGTESLWEGMPVS